MSLSECYCDYDAPEFWSQSRPKATKEHRCYECRGIIKPGDRYERVAGKWEGDFSTFKTCERCCDLRQWVKNNVPCFCWYHGDMLSDAEDAVNDAASRAPSETVGLRFGFQRRRHAITLHNQRKIG